MGWPFGNDRKLAETKYAGRQSATDAAAEQRRRGHRRSIGRTAAAGQAWEDRDRQQDRKGRWYRPAR
ncbi:hypothetical protein AB0D11_02440 [Streptomyces monashensis]|uniref:hypothetical protein n=1 Tax=Streptomyces monashensis TaxID=1678012 RepID=UPI0033F33970